MVARRSIRKFKQDKIQSYILHECIDAARLAPSSFNGQNLKFTIVYNKLDFMFRNLKFAGLVGGYKIQDDEKPTAYVIISANTKYDISIDVGIAAHAIVNKAHEFGIGSCIMGSFSDRIVLPGMETKLVIALGVAKETPSIIESDGNVRYYVSGGRLVIPKRKKADILIDEEKLNDRQKYVVDIDGTVCTQEIDYEKATPMTENIKRLNELYREGNQIQYFTARGTETGIDWKDRTIKQLKDWGCPNPTNVLFGKPAADVYIDDKALNACKEEWK